jgi:hypothetical protein
MQYIRLLCQSGAGLQAIASPFCEAVRELIGAASGSIFWLSDHDEPVGFYHDCAPAEIKDLFVTRFDDAFFASEPVNIAMIASQDGPSVGKMLDPAMQRAFAGGNIHRLLCVPLGHDLFLDMSAFVPGSGKAAFCGWYPTGWALSHSDAGALLAVQPLMEHALASPPHGANWRSIGTGSPHIIVSEDGGELLAIDAEAERILMSSQLLRQNLSPIDQPRQAPGFVAQMVGQLAVGETAKLHLPVPDGRLVCRASRTRLLNPTGNGSNSIFVSLSLEIADEVAKVGYLMALELTPLQRDIAAFALLGGERQDCMEALRVGSEALKKHLRAVFEVTGTARWSDLQSLSASHWLAFEPAPL